MLLQKLCRLFRWTHHLATGYHGDICSLADSRRAVHLERYPAFFVDIFHRISADTDISGFLILNQRFHQFSRLMAVAWHVDPHVRNRAHGRKILGRMMAHSQGAIADSSADSYQLHICVGVGHIHLGLFIASRT